MKWIKLIWAWWATKAFVIIALLAIAVNLIDMQFGTNWTGYFSATLIIMSIVGFALLVYNSCKQY